MARYALIVFVAFFSLSACSTYDPLSDEPDLRKVIGNRLDVDMDAAVKVTFLGNTTLVVRDNNTTLLVDGFLSRPGRIQTLFRRVGPSEAIFMKALGDVGVNKVDAVLVGHAHHDHALDATAIADRFPTAQAYGSASFANLYEGSTKREGTAAIEIPPEGRDDIKIGAFKVDFKPSTHVAPKSFVQRLIDGEIKEPLKLPAHFTRLNCGAVFALHIKHAEGNIVVTTTAGAKKDALKGLTPTGQRPPVFFLGIGYLDKVPKDQAHYWEHTVTAVQPEVIVPVHWDDFTRPLKDGLKVPPRLFFGDTRATIKFVKDNAAGRKVRIMDLGETLYLQNRKIYVPEVAAR